MFKKISIIICLMIFVNVLIFPKSVNAKLSTVDGWFSTTMTLENKIGGIGGNELINGDNVIAEITLVPSHDDEMQLRDFKIACRNNIPYDFNMNLRIKWQGGNELGTALASSGDFGFINHEFTNALYLEVIAEGLTGIVYPHDYVIACSFNKNNIELANLLTGDIYHPNTEVAVAGNPEITVENISSSKINNNTKNAEILKFSIQSDQDFELNQLQIECSSDKISSVELYDNSDYAIWNNNSVLSSNLGFSWAKKGFLFSSTILIPSGNRQYSIRADIPTDMSSQTLKCGISADTVEIGTAFSQVEIVNKKDFKLEVSLGSSNPSSSTIKKGLSDFNVLWLELHADSQQDLTMYKATFEKFGLLNNNYIERVYLFDNQRHLLAEGNILSNNRVIFGGFNNVIKKWETHNFILSVAISQGAEELKQFGFSFVSASVLDEDKDNVSISGNLPIKGNVMMIAQENKSVVVSTPTPSTPVATTPTPTPVVTTPVPATSTPAPTPTVALTPSQTLPENTLIKLPADPKIYVIKNGKRKWIKTIQEFNQQGYKWSDVKETTASVVSAYAEYMEAASNLIRAVNKAKVYKVINNKKLWIPTAESFNKMGNKWEDIQSVSQTEENKYPRVKLVKLANDEKVYYLTEGGYKKYIPSTAVFNSYDNKQEDIVEIESADLNAYPDVMLIRAIGGEKVYKLENNIKKWIKTAVAFNRLGLDWNAVAPVNTTELNAYSEGGAIE